MDAEAFDVEPLHTALRIGMPVPPDAVLQDRGGSRRCSSAAATTDAFIPKPVFVSERIGTRSRGYGASYSYSSLQVTMQPSFTTQYRGYAVRPSAHCLPDGSFSSNLTLRRSDVRTGPTLYEFYSLGYFDSEEDALGHSNQWAREWIDTRG